MSARIHSNPVTLYSKEALQLKQRFETSNKKNLSPEESQV